MKKKANKSGLSRIAINFIIILLIVIIGGVIFILVRNIMSNQGEQDVFDDSTLDLKISQVQKINDNTLDVTVKRNEGMGEFVALSFAVDDGALMEIIRINSSMPEMQEEVFSLNFVLLNSSKIKRVSITPIFIDKKGNEVIGNVKDEYITPNVCSNYCPTNSQCGVNDCGVKCGNGCGSGYLCLNYKCIREQTSSGGGGGSSSSSTTTCTDTCASLTYQCGTQTICGESVNCGTCSTGYVCSSGLCIEEESCTDTCSSLGYTCGTYNICGVNTNCGTCSTGYTCAMNGTCIKNCVPTTCSALSRTCGTVSNGCGGTLNCGSCTTGYTCAANGTCIKDVVITCNGVTCNSGEYCSNGVCLLNVAGNTYFVSTTGSDSNSGTFTLPWATWKKGFESAQPGDIVYFRGGTYIAQGVAGTYVEVNYVEGTEENQLYFFNYPGETPILDGSSLTPGTLGYNTAIGFGNCHWFNLRGLTVRNFYQMVGTQETHLATGIGAYDCSNFHFKNCVAHNIGGRGFYYISKGNSGGWTTPDNSSWVNCDSYNLVDPLSFYIDENGARVDNSGNAADGFFIQVNANPPPGHVLIEGCRAWNVSDDGFNLDGDAYFEVKNCWSFNNYHPEVHLNEGNGFKLDTGYVSSTNLRNVTNCIVANNPGMAFDTNNGGDAWPRQTIYNCLSYNNLLGNIVQNCDETPMPDASVNVVRNMISYKDSWGAFENVPWLQGGTDYFFTEDHNTWRTIYQYPYWETNPAYTVTDDDFVSLDVSQLMRSRNTDGSLPDITFGHLKAESDLIDRGVNVGLPYSGSAPDLGPFESNY